MDIQVARNLSSALQREAPVVPLRDSVRRAVALFIRLMATGIAVVIVWLWAWDGGITGGTSLGAALTSAGRLTGLFGAYLLLIQILLLARIPAMQWIVGFDRLAALHRLNGKLSLSLILAHVGLITTGYALTDRLTVPQQLSVFLSSYPGMMAALVGTILLVLVVVTSLVIVRRRLRYEAWYLVHLMAYLGVFLTWFHQIPTGKELVTNPVAAAFWTGLYVGTLQLLLLFRVAQPLLRSLWHGLRVAAVTEEGPGVYSVHITGRRLDWMDVRAGQFFLWRFLDGERWKQSHPFSLSAAPDGRSLRITVKALGDFSGHIAQLKPGTRVIAEGPFGSFTGESRSLERVALVAGGVGITPIRALLEEMDGDLALIYRVNREEDILFRPELERLARERGITIHYVTGSRKVRGNEHLLSPGHLRKLLPDIAHRDVYLCGPESMMRSLIHNLRRLGVPQQHIHVDTFAY